MGEECETAVAGERIAGQHVDAAAKVGEPSAARKVGGPEFADPVVPERGRAQRLAAG